MDETTTLTPRQVRILEFIREAVRDRGYPPTVREIGEAVGLTSSSSVHSQLANLERRGLLRKDPTKPRAIGLQAGGSAGDPGVQVSARTGEGLDVLLEAVASTLPAPPVDVTLVVPFDREDVVARLYREAEILEREPDTTGTLVKARVGEAQLAWVKEFLVRPVRMTRG